MGHNAAKFQTTKEAADRWGVHYKTAALWCRLGKIRGAVLIGRDWTIPADAPPPEYRNRPRSKQEATR